MDKNMDKSLFFITLACICVWVIVDVAVGKNYLSKFLGTIFPFMAEETGSLVMTEEEVKEAQNNAPSSSAIGSGKDSTGAPVKGNQGWKPSNYLTGEGGYNSNP